MEGFAFESCLRFTFQLLCAEAAFALLFPRQPRFWLRLLSTAIPFGIGLSLIYHCATLVPGRHLWTFTLYYAAIFCLSMLPIRSCFVLTQRETLFAAIGGYAVQHMAFGLTQLVRYYTHFSSNTLAGYILQHFFFFFLLPPLLHSSFLRQQFDRDGLQKRDWRLVFLAVLALTINVVLSQASRMATNGSDPSFLRNCICSLYIVLCSSMELFLLFYIPHESRMRQESELMEKMLHTMDSRLKLSRKGIEIINRRCHALKLRIGELTEENARLSGSTAAAETQKALAFYEGDYRTGNATLDFVLNERSPILQEENITFSCIADGKLLDFMRMTDISILFGNALDNALEYSLKQPDPEHRIITLRVDQQGEMVHIHLANYCKEAICFQDGLPIAPDNSSRDHGFGIQSICYLTEKYGGIYHFRQKDDYFILDIACPIAQKASTKFG